VAQKFGTFLYAYDFVKYRPISQTESGKISNNTINKDRTTPQMCRYTTLWNVIVLKQQLKSGRLITLRCNRHQ